MKWLKRIDRQTFLTVFTPLLISLLASLVAAWVTRGSEYFVFIIGTFFILTIFGLAISYQAGRLSERVESSLDKRLPEIKFIIGDENELRYEILTTVSRAKSFVATTGGRARMKEYLDAIETKVLKENIRYIRVIPSPPKYDPNFAIRHELCQHLCRVFANTQGRKLTTIRRTSNLSIGYYLVTDAGFIIFMPNPRPKAPFDTCISMPGRPEISDRYREYIVETLGGGGTENITTERRVRELCRECSQGEKSKSRDSSRNGG